MLSMGILYHKANMIDGMRTIQNKQEYNIIHAQIGKSKIDKNIDNKIISYIPRLIKLSPKTYEIMSVQ